MNDLLANAEPDLEPDVTSDTPPALPEEPDIDVEEPDIEPDPPTELPPAAQTAVSPQAALLANCRHCGRSVARAETRCHNCGGPNPTAAPAATVEVALVPVPLMEIIPADVELPALIKFVPNAALRAKAEEATTYLLGIDVTGPEGLQRVDLALAAERDTRKVIEAHFAGPVDIANKVHKRLTTLRGEWCDPGERAARVVGQRVWAERQRLERIAADERRQAQEEANSLAREQAARETEAARKNQAPPQVVQELERRAETAVAPPVSAAASAPPPMQATTVVTTWKARIKGTPANDDPNPKMADLSPAQWEQVKALLRDIIDDKAPRTSIELCWSVLNARAKAEKGTLAIAGVEAFQDGGVRAKGGRRS